MSKNNRIHRKAMPWMKTTPHPSTLMLKTLLARAMPGAVAVRVTVALAPILLSVLVCVMLADEAAHNSNESKPFLYKDKTAAQWINELHGSSDENSRADAAEALGFLAREGRPTPGSFSDVPLDSPEPPKLEEDALQPIVTALVSGLNDSHGRVRASSAIAVSWIGSCKDRRARVDSPVGRC